MLRREELRKNYVIDAQLSLNKGDLKRENETLGFFEVYHVTEYNMEILGAPEVVELYPKQKEYTDDEKKERVLSFIEQYAEDGFIINAAKAVNVSYPMLMLWVKQLGGDYATMLQLAQESVKAMYRDTGHGMALNGDGQMIRFFLSEDQKARVVKTGEGMVSVETSDSSMGRVLEILTSVPQIAKELS